MIISASGGKKDYAPCPEYTGKAVCVDVTPLKEYETEYGTKKKFKFAFEIALQDPSRDPSQPWVVFTRPMVPSLHEKAGLTKFLRDWFGRPLTPQETQAFDVESLIGKSATLVIAHEQSADGTKTYANIKLIMPLKQGELIPSGQWVRLKDRPSKDENGSAALTKAQLLATAVHVGKFRGTAISDLTETAVNGLAEVWVPKAMANKDITAEDKRLIAAINARLEEIKANREITDSDDILF
jgi:hypothetical protein